MSRQTCRQLPALTFERPPYGQDDRKNLPEGRIDDDSVVSGEFDPITNGHMDTIEQAAKVFDRLFT